MCVMGLWVPARGLWVCDGSVHGCNRLVHMQWVSVYVMCTWVEGVSRMRDTGGAAKDEVGSRESRSFPWDWLSPLAPPHPSRSPQLLYTSAKKKKKKEKARKNSKKALNEFFHQFSSAFGVSAAAFSPDSCSSPLKKELICGLLPPVFRWK